MFHNFSQTFTIIFIIIAVMITAIFIVSILSIISPKFRGKMMSRQVRATKHMVDYSKQDLEDINTDLESVVIKAKKNILDEHEEDLKEFANREANIKKDYVKTMASAIHEGRRSKNTIYCKHCGSMIDSDSIFCKHCGKEQ